MSTLTNNDQAYVDHVANEAYGRIIDSKDFTGNLGMYEIHAAT